MSPTVQSATRSGLIISPPYVIAPDIGVIAIDATFGLSPTAHDRGLPLICMGGHPAPECLLDAEGPGQSHPVTLVIDPSLPGHRQFLARIRTFLDPSVPLQVVAQDKYENGLNL